MNNSPSFYLLRAPAAASWLAPAALALCALGTGYLAPAARAVPVAGCQMATVFPDGSRFEETCQVSIVPPGLDPAMPKGWIKFLDFNNKVQIFSLNFYPPPELKVHTVYPLTTDISGSFLNGVVQPAGAHQQCRMTAKFPTAGSVTFSAVGSIGVDFHGTVIVYPACYLNFGSPSQTLVPGNQSGGGSTTIVF